VEGLAHGVGAGVTTGVEVVVRRFASLAVGGGVTVDDKNGFGILVSILLRIWTDLFGS